MPHPAADPSATSVPRLVPLYENALRRLVQALGFVAGLCLLVMVLVTTLEVVLRVFRLSLTGAYDVVKIAAGLALAAALPYTTAIKGHVAIEYFFHKLGRRGRAAVDALMRLLGAGLFSLLAWGSFRYGTSLKRSGEVMLTLQVPVFWLPYVLGASCLLVVLIKLYHLSHPGKALLQP